jgi:hypothetical protein
MGAFTNTMEAEIVEVFLRKASKTGGNIYVALFQSDPGEASGGTETAYTGYARQLATWTALDGNGQTKNEGALQFPANGNPVNPVTITHLVLLDALTGGNRLLYAPLTTSKTLSPGDVLSFAVNAIVFGLD